MKKKKKIIIILSIVVVILVLLALVFKMLFGSNSSSRNSDIKKYKITSDEKTAVISEIKSLDEVKKVDIHTNNNSKIIKIVVNLSSDVDFDKIKEIAKKSISGFSEKNLKYYDIEFFVDSDSENSIYPKIGSKFRSNEGFSW